MNRIDMLWHLLLLLILYVVDQHQRREVRKKPRHLLFTSPEAVSALTTPTVCKPSTSATVSDLSLHVNGKLNCRLNCTLDHLPRPADDNRRCALHMWSGKMRVESSLLYCNTCTVTLCSECYRTFHVEADLVEKKQEIEKKLRRAYNKNREGRNMNDETNRKNQKKT